VIQISYIAEKCDIPKTFLEQIFNKLKNVGLIESIRGSKGGYKLAHDPSKITFLEIFTVLEGKIDFSKNYSVNDAVKNLYKEMEANVQKMLSKSLEEMLVEQQKLDNNIVYHI